MAWVVDTCVLIDVSDEDAVHGQRSAEVLERHLDQGLVLSPMSYVELAPAFDGSSRRLADFLSGAGVMVESMTSGDVDIAFRLWAQHVSDKRSGRVSRRPIADVFIAALALRSTGLITRNARDFWALCPHLPVCDPAERAR